ncbi:TatD family hydrolase [Candidatus Saccharibacteria bacterium]|nr:TatD family hydrolase [Candidatus Saccharibacteria bacterium]
MSAPYLVDSHCHLHDREFFSESQAEDMLKNAKDCNVKQIICIGTNHSDSLEAKKFASTHPNVFWTYGIHPEETSKNDDFKPVFSNPEEVAVDSRLVAIGEVGLDYHYTGYDRAAQIKLLEQMLQLAISLNLPCSFHVRDALDDFFGIIDNFSSLKPSVLHSFTDSSANLKKAISRGLYIGFNGIATFANLSCYKVFTPDFLSYCVLETDAPFLTPEPKRGKINEPGNIKYIAAYLANQLGVSPTQVAKKTTQNVRNLFNLPYPD